LGSRGVLDDWRRHGTLEAVDYALYWLIFAKPCSSVARLLNLVQTPTFYTEDRHTLCISLFISPSIARCKSSGPHLYGHINGTVS
jgi:hypothetical protein